MTELSLTGDWLATWGDGLHSWRRQAFQPLEDSARYLTFKFPGSIQTNLAACGLLADPRLSINSLKARWVEEHFWILRKKFSVPAEAATQSPHLHFDVIDGVAQVILNGEEVGTHSDAFYPAEFDLSGHLRAGENELVLLLESGLFKVADLSYGDYSVDEAGVLNKRHHLRQAQYQFGWDWNPRLIFFGLHGKIQLVWGDLPRLQQVSLIAEVTPDLASACLRLRSFWFNPQPNVAQVRLELKSLDGLYLQTYAQMQPGENMEELVLEVPHPRLWWPRGYGEPFLYPLELKAWVDDRMAAEWHGQTGIRRVELSQPIHPEEGRYFHIKVNNQLVFFKGANWVPPEMSPFEVSIERLERLVALAVAQNFNALRIWGGGVWAGHPLLDLCDRNGLLVWHDLLFACSKYPVDRPDFLAEVQREIAWGLREFSLHPSLVVWCGNNEMEEGWWSWHYPDFGKTAPDYVLFHQVIPRLLRQIDPTRPYWPSSPYSSPDFHPQDPTRGDQHPWSVSLGPTGLAEDFWRYRRFVDRFPNEGGVLGASPLASLRRFLEGNELQPRSFAWEHHDNTVQFWHPEPGIAYRMVERWLGRPVSQYSLQEYVIASGLIQAEGLKEYIRNYRRRYPSTTSAIYWDYVDSWPSVHGWGTLDYYLRRKPAFQVVRRAFAPLVVILADEQDCIGVYIVSDVSNPPQVILKAGFFEPNGAREERLVHSFQPASFSSQRVGQLAREAQLIFYAVLEDLEGKMLAWDRLLLQPFHAWKLSLPSIQVTTVDTPAGRLARYFSPQWVWNVLLDPDGEGKAADDAFDLLPGLPYDLPLPEGCDPLPVRFTGNELLA